MPAIRFTAQLQKLDEAAQSGPGVLLALPKSASAKLPSRGMVIIEGAVNGVRFRVVLQPDGQGSHWFKLNKATCQTARIETGDTVTLEIKLSKEWPEPKLTPDVEKALAADPQAHARWMDTTPMARWEWLNWMGSVKLPKTRRERPEKLCSMLKAGKRRPCCFNRALQMSPVYAEQL
jgi:hypothetical protein